MDATKGESTKKILFPLKGGGGQGRVGDYRGNGKKEGLQKRGCPSGVRTRGKCVKLKQGLNWRAFRGKTKGVWKSSKAEGLKDFKTRQREGKKKKAKTICRRGSAMFIR